MTYYLLQSAAMLIVAYFVGCLFGCVLKSLFVTAPAEAFADGPGDYSPPPAPVRAPAATAMPRVAKPAAPVVPPPAPAATPTPVVAAKPQPAAPARPMSPPPGSGVSAEVTAAAAAAAAATLATAGSVRASAAPAPAPGTPAAPRVPVAPAAPVASGPVIVPGDDLKRIKGIGPEIERKLNAIGVRRYSEIAGWSAADVARITKEIGQDGRVQHENWIEQAQILARGGETAFSRRVDRREVNTGMVDTWTPTAPNEVARQAAAPAQPLSPPAARPMAPVAAAPAAPASVSTAGSGAVAVAAAAAAAASTLARPAATQSTPPAPPAAPAVVPPAAPVVAAAKPAAPPAPPATPVSAAPVVPAAPAVSQPISMRPAPGAGNQRRFVRLAAPEGKPDDLSLVSGIGDKIAGDLNRYGIYHYWQLSAMGPDDIDYMESRLGHKGRMRREEWPEQARELMSGKPPRARTDRERAHGSDAAPADATQTTATASGVHSPTTHTHTHTAHTHVHTPKSTESAAPAAPASPSVAPAIVTAAMAPASSGQPAGAPPAKPATPVDLGATPVGTAPAAPHHGTTHHHTQPVTSADAPPASSDTATAHTQRTVHHGTVHHHVAGATLTASAAAAAAAIAASAGQTSPAAPVTAKVAPPVPPAPPPAAPARVAPVAPPAAPAAAPVQAAPPPAVASAPAAADTSGSTWTPRSRPGNQAARTRDDLKRIKGIGVVIEKKLEAMGITSYSQIAAWKTPDIDKVSNALDFKGRIERENWVEQARILDGGGQTDFSRRMDRGDMPGGGQQV